MLSINKKAENCLILHNKHINALEYTKQYFTQDYLQSIDAKSYHLYILSEEIIKEDDWYFDKDNNKIDKLQKEETPMSYDCKIIASTDINLEFSPFGGQTIFTIPSLSLSFIGKYVNSYNKGNIIKEVMIEYEQCKPNFEWHKCRFCNIYTDVPDSECGYKNTPSNKLLLIEMELLVPKVNPKENTITIKEIKEIKDSFTRTEVKQLAWFAVKHSSKLKTQSTKIIRKEVIDDFLENEMG